MQLTDSNGNIYGINGLEITGIDGKPKVPSSAATLIVNSTPITGGTVGRVLFQGAGNVLQQSGNLFWDATNNRLGIGTTLPANTLDVNGTARVSGTTTITPAALTGTAETSALDISQTWNTTGTPTAIKLNITDTASNGNSRLLDIQVGGASRFIFAKNGNLFFGAFNNSSNIQGDSATRGLILRTSMTTTAGNGFLFSNLQGNIANLSSTAYGLTIQPAGTFGFNPTSGTGNYNSIRINDKINQTGGANGITRGLFIDATLTAAADFRAIETTVGKVCLNTTSGNTMIGTTTDAGYRLDVNGSVRATGSISAASAVARGTYLNQTLVATANNDVLVGLDINPTFTTGAFTGVQQENLVIRGNTNPIIRFKNQAGNTTWGQITANASELSFNAGNGSLNFTAGNTIGMYMFTATRNVLIQNGGTFTDAGYRFDVNGTTRLQSTLLVSGATTTTSLITANGGITSSLNGYGVTIGTNAAFSNDTTRLAQSPATWIWHDLFAFNRYNATYETYNGTTWSSATLNTELFAQKQTQSIQVINTTILASRWTFNSTGWGTGQWLVIGVAWDASIATYNVLLESYDGTAWVTRHTSNSSIAANNYFASVSAYSGDNQLRVTITRTGGGNNLNISNIKLLTARPGDQGVGSDVEFPYYWNGTRSIGIGTSSVINASAILDVGSTTKGFLPPRMSNAQMLAIVSPASGLIVYDTTSQKHFGYNGSSWNAFF